MVAVKVLFGGCRVKVLILADDEDFKWGGAVLPMCMCLLLLVDVCVYSYVVDIVLHASFTVLCIQGFHVHAY